MAEPTRVVSIHAAATQTTTRTNDLVDLAPTRYGVTG
jgi:hypothetical protein